jgi:hypothetical protein
MPVATILLVRFGANGFTVVRFFRKLTKPDDMIVMPKAAIAMPAKLFIEPVSTHASDLLKVTMSAANPSKTTGGGILHSNQFFLFMLLPIIYEFYKLHLLSMTNDRNA